MNYENIRAKRKQWFANRLLLNLWLGDFYVIRRFMTRGNFDFINSNVAYSESDKSWWIDLINTDCIWYDMMINPPDDIRTNKIIKTISAPSRNM